MRQQVSFRRRLRQHATAQQTSMSASRNSSSSGSGTRMRPPARACVPPCGSACSRFCGARKAHSPHRVRCTQAGRAFTLEQRSVRQRPQRCSRVAQRLPKAARLLCCAVRSLASLRVACSGARRTISRSAARRQLLAVIVDLSERCIRPRSPPRTRLGPRPLCQRKLPRERQTSRNEERC